MKNKFIGKYDTAASRDRRLRFLDNPVIRI